MDQSLMELVFILDRSGSMSGKESDTIGGFNSLIEKQKGEEGDALVTVVLFDDQYEVLYDRVSLKTIPKMTTKEYYVRGSTALLDAVGKTINKTKAIQDGTEEAARPGKTLFVIITDGLENASREYRADVVKNLVETRKKDDDWEFLFIGANIDSVAEASKIGIDANRAAGFATTGESMRSVYDTVESVVRTARKSKGRMSDSIADNWSDDIKS
ncbi:MAG: VWA domain-containing protein [Thermoplasmata archaeon]|nr:VWA domain-containing protein [Thermoplasmata archaeon]